MIEPRSTQDQLLAAIRSECHRPSLSWGQNPRPLTGGFWAEMLVVSFTSNDVGLDGELVARIMPDPEVAERETAVQAHLANHGYPTPKVRLAAGPSTDLDRAWMIMDLANGQPLLDDLSGPSTLLRLPELARSLPDQLAQHAAALHMLNPGPLTRPDDDISNHLQKLETQACEIGRQDLASIARWMSDTRPVSARPVICHGDLHPFNILTNPTGDTVLDWSSACVADPSYDLSFTSLLLSRPPLSAPRPVSRVLNIAGTRLAKRLLRTYNDIANSPLDPAQLEWFTSFHRLRILVEVATWTAQNELDQHPDHPFLTLVDDAITQLKRAQARQNTWT